MVTNNISIGQKIRTIRKRKGFTQAMLAEVIGRSPTYISYIESGFKSMSLETFVLIANALNATADEILEDSLENTVKVSNHEFASILMDCNDYEKRFCLMSQLLLSRHFEITALFSRPTANNYP